MGYAGLEIAEGMTAAASYARMTGGAPESERAEIREALLTYCKRDTEAMVGVYEALLIEARNHRESD